MFLWMISVLTWAVTQLHDGWRMSREMEEGSSESLWCLCHFYSCSLMTNTHCGAFLWGLPPYVEHLLRTRSEVSGLRYIVPVFTWTEWFLFNSRIRRSSACDPRAEPDAGLFMCLSPHRVPDRNHPRQHRSRSAEFPSTETLVIITVYYRPCQDIVFYSSVSLLSELQKSPSECTTTRNSRAVCRCVQNVSAGLFGYEPLPNWQLSCVSHWPDSLCHF